MKNVEAAVTADARASHAPDLLLRHCLAFGATAEPKQPPRVRLEEALGPELTQRAVDRARAAARNELLNERWSRGRESGRASGPGRATGVRARGSGLAVRLGQSPRTRITKKLKNAATSAEDERGGAGRRRRRARRTR